MLDGEGCNYEMSQKFSEHRSAAHALGQSNKAKYRAVIFHGKIVKAGLKTDLTRVAVLLKRNVLDCTIT
jgi:hypothetical protein